MLGTLITIWIIGMIVSGIVKSAGNKRKRQELLDYQHAQMLKSKQQWK